MLTVTGLWFDHERTPVGLDHTPVFGWQLEGNCRNIRQTQYRLQVALTPDFAALLYDETCETGNSTAVHAAGLTLQSLQKYYARVQVWADTAAGPQQTLWSEPAVFIRPAGPGSRVESRVCERGIPRNLQGILRRYNGARGVHRKAGAAGRVCLHHGAGAV